MTEPLTAVVVDDEQRARRRLVRLLEGWPGVEVVAQASGGLEAVELIERLDPRIVFLDVQMPDLDGFGVLRKLSRAPRYVVFTTAHDSYAMDAFEVGAVDYLLKPFGEREVGRAVARAVERSAEAEFRQGYQRLMEALDRPRYSESLPVTYLKNIVLLPVSEISRFEADQEMVAIHALGQQYSTDLTLTELQRRLDPGDSSAYTGGPSSTWTASSAWSRYTAGVTWRCSATAPGWRSPGPGPGACESTWASDRHLHLLRSRAAFFREPSEARRRRGRAPSPNRLRTQ